jgi:hypothetical protein
VPLFRSRPRSALLTAIISVDQDQWNVIWIGSGGLKEPSKFNAPTLTEAAEQATTAAVARQAGSRRAPGGELQFAVYPWAYQKGGPIYRVTREPDRFKAGDSEREITAGTLEDLVAALRREPSGKQGMLLWIRQFADLIVLTRASMQPGRGLSALYLR